jgi:hypothetical protein
VPVQVPAGLAKVGPDRRRAEAGAVVESLLEGGAAVTGIVPSVGRRVMRAPSAESERRQERPSVAWKSTTAAWCGQAVVVAQHVDTNFIDTVECHLVRQRQPGRR